MNYPNIIFILTILLCVSILAWVVYSIWLQSYSLTNISIQNRLKYFSSDSRNNEYESNINRFLSKNKAINTFLSSLKVVNDIEAQLVKGKLRIQVDHFLIFVFVAILFTFISFIILDSSIFISLIAAFIIGFLPFLLLRMLVSRRQAILERQLPHILEYISRAMQAGHTFVGSLKLAAEESPEPIGSEFEKAFREINFGKSVQNSMSDLAHRIDCPEMRYFAVAVFINHEIGGNLAHLLTGVATLIRDRLKLKLSVHALTSEARVSAWILGLLPFAVALILFAVRPDFISVLWREPSGRTMLSYTLILMIVGVIWMQRLSKIRF